MNKNIVAWIPEPPPNGDIGSIAEFYDSILHSFSSLARSPSIETILQYRGRDFLRKEFERLFLWGTGHAVQDGRLDRVLSNSRELKQAILARLYEIGSLMHYTLIPRLIPETEIQTFSRNHEELARHLSTTLHLTGETHEDVIFDDTDKPDNYALDDIPDIFEELRTINDCLAGLSVIIDDLPVESNSDIRAVGSIETFKVASPDALPYCHKIRDRFPELSKRIVERLGEANAIRAEYLSMRSAQQEKDNVEVPEESLMSSSRPTATSSSKKSSVFDDKLPNIPNDARSIITFASLNTTLHGDNSGKRRVPPLPSLSSVGGPFECPFCFSKLKIIDRSEWK